jgi:hypothetical protein
MFQHNICLLKDCAPTTDINLKQEVESVTESDGDAEVRNRSVSILQTLFFLIIH